MKQQKFIRFLFIQTAFFGATFLAAKAVSQQDKKTPTGSIQWRSSAMLVVPCDEKNLDSTVQLWSENPINDKGEKNPKAKSTELSCKDLEPIDAGNSIVYIKDGAKANAEGFITVTYQNKGKWAEALILEKNYDRHESLCEYAFKKNDWKKKLDAVVGQIAYEDYEQEKKDAEENLKEIFPGGLSCSAARNIGFHEPLLQNKKCIYDNSRILNAPSSGRCIVKRMNEARAKGVDILYDEYLKTFGATALALDKKHGLPAELFLAKVQLETGNGTSSVLAQNNNIGGIGYLYGRGVTVDVTSISGKKKTIKAGYANTYFKFNSVQEGLDYYGNMMLYQPETHSAYEGLRNSICSNTNQNVDLDKSETVSPHRAADSLVRYSELGMTYVNELKRNYINAESIRTFKEKYMLCDGEDEVAMKFYEACAKGELKDSDKPPIFDDSKKGDLKYDDAFDKYKKKDI